MAAAEFTRALALIDVAPTPAWSDGQLSVGDLVRRLSLNLARAQAAQSVSAQTGLASFRDLGFGCSDTTAPVLLQDIVSASNAYEGDGHVTAFSPSILTGITLIGGVSVGTSNAATWRCVAMAHIRLRQFGRASHALLGALRALAAVHEEDALRAAQQRREIWIAMVHVFLAQGDRCVPRHLSLK